MGKQDKKHKMLDFKQDDLKLECFLPFLNLLNEYMLLKKYIQTIPTDKVKNLTNPFLLSPPTLSPPLTVWLDFRNSLQQSKVSMYR